MADWSEMMTPAERAGVRRIREAQLFGENEKYDEGDLLMARMGLMYGWDAIRDIMRNEMSVEMLTRLAAAGDHILRERTALRLTDMGMAANVVLGGRKAAHKIEAEAKHRVK